MLGEGGLAQGLLGGGVGRPRTRSGACRLAERPWGGGGVWHKAMVLVCLPLAAPIGPSPSYILTLRGSGRVVVMPTEPLNPCVRALCPCKGWSGVPWPGPRREHAAHAPPPGVWHPQPVAPTQQNGPYTSEPERMGSQHKTLKSGVKVPWDAVAEPLGGMTHGRPAVGVVSVTLCDLCVARARWGGGVRGEGGQAGGGGVTDMALTGCSSRAGATPSKSRTGPLPCGTTWRQPWRSGTCS